MDHFLMKPKIDFAFKEIMENEKARTGFLAAVLQLDPADIKETRILNSNLRRMHEDDKLGILDVRILLNDDTQIDTEIQLAELKIWADRALFYISKMYTEQIEKGQKYDVLKKCVSISILDFILEQRGEQRGIQIGEQRGIQIGEQRGREQEAVSIALNLISLGLDDVTIANATHLAPDRIKSLRKEYT